MKRGCQHPGCTLDVHPAGTQHTTFHDSHCDCHLREKKQ